MHLTEATHLPDAGRCSAILLAPALGDSTGAGAVLGGIGRGPWLRMCEARRLRFSGHSQRPDFLCHLSPEEMFGSHVPSKGMMCPSTAAGWIALEQRRHCSWLVTKSKAKAARKIQTQMVLELQPCFFFFLFRSS